MGRSFAGLTTIVLLVVLFLGFPFIIDLSPASLMVRGGVVIAIGLWILISLAWEKFSTYRAQKKLYPTERK